MKVPKPRKLKSGAWFIQLRLDGESIPITAASEKECIRHAQKVKAEYLAGRMDSKYVKNKKFLTVNDAVEKYITSREATRSPSTIAGYEAIRRTRFQSIMGRNIYEMEQRDWQSACNEETKLCSAKTLKNAWGLMKSVIQEETGNNAPKVNLPSVIPNERPFLTPSEINVFINAVHGKTVEIPALLALSSLRRSEILALRWENIDLDKKIVKVYGAAVVNKENKLEQKKQNKNISSRRIVPIMIPSLLDALQNSKKENGLVVVCNPNSIWAQINQICRENGLPEVGVHGLRHSFASLAYHLNVPEKIVMEIGGWSDYQTMRKIYTHVAKSDVQERVQQISDFFSNPENAN